MAFDSEPSGSNSKTGTDRDADQFDLAQAEALAKVAALAADREDDLGPSKMMVGTAITLGVLVVAMLVLALALSI